MSKQNISDSDRMVAQVCIMGAVLMVAVPWMAFSLYRDYRKRKAYEKWWEDTRPEREALEAAKRAQWIEDHRPARRLAKIAEETDDYVYPWLVERQKWRDPGLGDMWDIYEEWEAMDEESKISLAEFSMAKCREQMEEEKLLRERLEGENHGQETNASSATG